MTAKTPAHDDLGAISLDGSGFEDEKPSDMEPLAVELPLDIELPPDGEEGVKHGN